MKFAALLIGWFILMFGLGFGLAKWPAFHVFYTDPHNQLLQMVFILMWVLIWWGGGFVIINILNKKEARQ